MDQMIWDIHTAFYPLQCPDSGSYIGYKKASGLVVELEIPADARRSSANLGRFLGGAGGQHLGQVCGGVIGGILVPVKHDLVAVGAGVDLAPVAISGLAVACAFERILEGPELAVGLIGDLLHGYSSRPVALLFPAGCVILEAARWQALTASAGS